MSEQRRSKSLLVAIIVGWAIIGFGIQAALHDARDAHPFALLVHVVTFDLGHDLLLAPATFAVFWLVGRLLPASVRGPVRTAIAASVLFVVFSYPLVKRWGRRPTNSSTLPLPYGRNLAIVLAIVWLIAAVVALTRVLRSRRTGPRPQ